MVALATSVLSLILRLSSDIFSSIFLYQMVQEIFQFRTSDHTRHVGPYYTSWTISQEDRMDRGPTGKLKYHFIDFFFCAIYSVIYDDLDLTDLYTCNPIFTFYIYSLSYSLF